MRAITAGERLREARATVGLELLTLTVTKGNTPAVGLYERSGFQVFGTLQKAIKMGDAYHAKLHMVKYL